MSTLIIINQNNNSSAYWTEYATNKYAALTICCTPLFQSDPNFYTVDEQGMFTCTMCQYQTYRRPNFYKHKKKHLGK